MINHVLIIEEIIVIADQLEAGNREDIEKIIEEKQEENETTEEKEEKIEIIEINDPNMLGIEITIKSQK